MCKYTLSHLCFKHYLLAFCSILIMAIYSLVHILNKAFLPKPNGIWCLLWGLSNGRAELEPQTPPQWEERWAELEQLLLCCQLSSLRAGGGSAQEPAHPPAHRVCELWLKQERSEGFLPAGLRMHLADTCCPQPCSLCLKRIPHNSFPASLGHASSMLSSEPPSFCFTPGEPSWKGTNLLGFNENVCIGWVQHGLTNQLLCHGNRLVHGDTQIWEVIQKPVGKHEPRGYQSLLKSTLKQSTFQEANIQNSTWTEQSKTCCPRGRQGECQNTVNWLCLLLSKLAGTDFSQKEKGNHIFRNAALTWAPYFSSRDSQRCQSQQLWCASPGACGCYGAGLWWCPQPRHHSQSASAWSQTAWQCIPSKHTGKEQGGVISPQNSK